MRSATCISAVLFLVAVAFCAASEPTTEELLNLAVGAGSSCPNDSCCSHAPAQSSYAEPGVQGVASTDVSLPSSSTSRLMSCDCGAGIQATLPACAALPLVPSVTYEAFALDVTDLAALALGGLNFEAMADSIPDVLSICVVTSKCGSGTFGFHQTGIPLGIKFPDSVNGPLALYLSAFMLSADASIEMTTITGLWKGGEETSGPLSVRGQAYVEGSLEIEGIEVGGYNLTIVMVGKLLFAMDLDKIASGAAGLDTLLQSTLSGGSLDFSDTTTPGFQLTGSVTVSVALQLSSLVRFKLPIGGGAAVTMGVNMQNWNGNGGGYRGYTNGLYACVFQEMTRLPDLLPILDDVFPCVAWPKMRDEQCLFLSTGGFGYRTTTDFSMLGASYSSLFSMTNTEASFGLQLSAWVITSTTSVVLPYTSAPRVTFDLSCGNLACADKIVVELTSTAVSELERAAKQFFDSNLIAELEMESGDDDIEGLLNEIESGVEGWRKKAKKAVKKTTSSVSKSTVDAANAAKKQADDAAKASADLAAKTAADAAKAAADLAAMFRIEAPYFRVSGVQASGSLCGFKLSMRMETGIKLCGKNYGTSEMVSVTWDPKTLFNDLVNAIPMPF